MLIPDKLDDETDSINKWQKFGVFGATFILFFLAEIGDKTQIATVALAARYDSIFWVMLGTTVGMMIANALLYLSVINWQNVYLSHLFIKLVLLFS